MKIEVSNNFSLVYIYKDNHLISLIDLDTNVYEVADELVDLFKSLDIDCKVIVTD